MKNRYFLICEKSVAHLPPMVSFDQVPANFVMYVLFKTNIFKESIENSVLS